MNMPMSMMQGYLSTNINGHHSNNNNSTNMGSIGTGATPYHSFLFNNKDMLSPAVDNMGQFLFSNTTTATVTHGGGGGANPSSGQLGLAASKSLDGSNKLDSFTSPVSRPTLLERVVAQSPSQFMFGNPMGVGVDSDGNNANMSNMLNGLGGNAHQGIGGMNTMNNPSSIMFSPSMMEPWNTSYSFMGGGGGNGGSAGGAGGNTTNNNSTNINMGFGPTSNLDSDFMSEEQRLREQRRREFRNSRANMQAELAALSSGRTSSSPHNALGDTFHHQQPQQLPDEVARETSQSPFQQQGPPPMSKGRPPKRAKQQQQHQHQDPMPPPPSFAHPNQMSFHPGSNNNNNHNNNNHMEPPASHQHLHQGAPSNNHYVMNKVQHDSPPLQMGQMVQMAQIGQMGNITNLHVGADGDESKATVTVLNCAKCDAAFRYKSRLLYHSLFEHGETELFACTACDSAFRRRSELRKHMNCVHEKHRPFQCTICPSGFYFRKDLRKHITTVHEKTRPFACEQCAETFTKKDLLTKHRLLVHERNNTGASTAVAASVATAHGAQVPQ